MRPWLVGMLVAISACGQASTRQASSGYDFPALTGRVVDAANLIPPEREAALTKQLVDLEDRSRHQLVVVTVSSLVGHTIEDYGRRLGNHWGIGRKGANDGVVLLVAPTERKVRIEVGRGLEAALTNAEAAAIIRTDILPAFRAGNFPQGIDTGVTGVIREIATP